MNEQTQGIVLGVIFAIVLMLVASALTIFLIYKFQPGFICDLCSTKQCELVWLPQPGFN